MALEREEERLGLGLEAGVVADHRHVAGVGHEPRLGQGRGHGGLGEDEEVGGLGPPIREP